jgi:hypothetical protein
VTVGTRTFFLFCLEEGRRDPRHYVHALLFRKDHHTCTLPRAFWKSKIEGVCRDFLASLRERLYTTVGDVLRVSAFHKRTWVVVSFRSVTVAYKVRDGFFVHSAESKSHQKLGFGF